VLLPAAYRERMRSLVFVIALCETAYAQAPGETPPRSDESKSIASAYMLTLAATAVPVAVAALGIPEGEQAHPYRAAALGTIGLAGLVLGPSAGHWYAGHKLTTGLVLRLGAAAGFATLTIKNPGNDEIGFIIVGSIVTAGLWEVGLIWDLATLPRAVRSHNNRRLQVAPLVAPNATGLALAGTF
jgi:hypothetical protein